MSGAKTLALAGLLLAIFVGVSLFTPSGWSGVDEAVLAPAAERLGRPATAPLINIEGDFLLFMFTLAGVIGGFLAGYSWRDLFGSRTQG